MAIFLLAPLVENLRVCLSVDEDGKFLGELGMIGRSLMHYIVCAAAYQFPLWNNVELELRGMELGMKRQVYFGFKIERSLEPHTDLEFRHFARDLSPLRKN